MLTTNLALLGFLLTFGLMTLLYGCDWLLTRLFSRRGQKRGQYDPSPTFWSWPQRRRRS